MLDSAKISKLIENEVQAGSLGGAAISIYSGNKPVLQHGFGIDQTNSIYKLYSMSKLVTLVATLRMMEAGQLRLSDPVAKYWPEFTHHQVFDGKGELHVAKTPLTIQHLLNMTSGMPYPDSSTPGGKQMALLESEFRAAAAAGQRFSTAEMTRRYAQVPGNFEPGSQWEYGASADMLGGLLETISQRPLDELYQTLVFDPLGMTDTGFKIDQAKLGQAAAMFSRDPLSQMVTKLERQPRTQPGIDQFTFPVSTAIDIENPMFLAGGGGIYSTAADYQHLLQLFLNEGEFAGNRLLKSSTVQFMHHNQLGAKIYATMHDNSVGGFIKGYSYSNLVRILVKPSEAEILGVGGQVGEYGWDGAGGNFCLIDPHQQITAVFMMNHLQGAEPILRRKLYQAICG